MYSLKQQKRMIDRKSLINKKLGSIQNIEIKKI